MRLRRNAVKSLRRMLKSWGPGASELHPQSLLHARLWHCAGRALCGPQTRLRPVTSSVTYGAGFGLDILDNGRSSPDFFRMTPTHVPERFDRSHRLHRGRADQRVAAVLAGCPVGGGRGARALCGELARGLAELAVVALARSLHRAAALSAVSGAGAGALCVSGPGRCGAYTQQKFFDQHTHRGGG